MQSQLQRLTFDSSRLVDFSERLLLECPAAQVTPLVREQGVLAITAERVYFQPAHNVAGGSRLGAWG